MVGPPKTLEDLRRVEGAVRVTCRACRHVRLLDREQLIRDRFARLQTTDWPTVQRELRCTPCGSTNVRVDGVPFSEDAEELRRRRVEIATVQLALAILVAAAMPGGRPEPMPEAVRLALRAIYPHLRNRAGAAKFWELWSKEFRLAHEAPAKGLAAIVQDLSEGGFTIPADLTFLVR